MTAIITRGRIRFLTLTTRPYAGYLNDRPCSADCRQYPGPEDDSARGTCLSICQSVEANPADNECNSRAGDV